MWLTAKWRKSLLGLRQLIDIHSFLVDSVQRLRKLIYSERFHLLVTNVLGQAQSWTKERLYRGLEIAQSKLLLSSGLLTFQPLTVSEVRTSNEPSRRFHVRCQLYPEGSVLTAQTFFPLIPSRSSKLGGLHELPLPSCFSDFTFHHILFVRLHCNH